MRTFKDTAGRTWTVPVNVDALKRVKALTGVDLLSIGAGGTALAARLADDPVLLVDVLFAACRLEAVAAGVTDEQFGQAMGGDALDDAAEALLGGLVDFFPRARREVLKGAMAKLAAARDLATDRAAARVAAMDPAAMVEEAEAAIASTPGGSSTSSPPSPV